MGNFTKSENHQGQPAHFTVSMLNALQSGSKSTAIQLAQYVDTNSEGFQDIKAFLRQHSGRTVSFKEYMDEIRNRFAIPNRRCHKNELFKLMSLYTYGEEPLASQNYWQFYYYLGCFLEQEWGEEPVWLSHSSEEDARTYWDMHCKGGNYFTIYDAFFHGADSMHPELSSAMEEICGVRDYQSNPQINETYHYYRVISAAVDPCKSDNPADVYARCFTARGICLKTLLLMFARKAESRLEFPLREQITGLLEIWTIRLLTLEETHGSGLAAYELYKLGLRGITGTDFNEYGPAIIERTEEWASDILDQSAEGRLTRDTEEGFTRRASWAKERGYGRADGWLEFIKKERKFSDHMERTNRQTARAQAQQIVRTQHGADLSAYREKLKERDAGWNYFATGLYLDGEGMDTLGRALSGTSAKELGHDLRTLGMTEISTVNERVSDRQEKLVQQETDRILYQKHREEIREAVASMLEEPIYRKIETKDTWLDMAAPGKMLLPDIDFWKENDDEYQRRQMMEKIFERMETRDDD